ncbi:MAG: 2-C-methyl-D-erythritol 2,4-cyclodiphosphate synthase [Candidatus Neomarinimicrobiota bacterium]
MNKVGIGVDFHSLIKGDHLIIGGHRIECEFSSQAHSDGDVLTHAIIDALLGALNLGDIGENFPNTSEYLNISSIKMLKKVVQKMPENTKIINIDASIVLNSPKISPYKNAIKESLSKVLNVSTDSISVKGTTTNNLGFVDMSNGWGAQAILMIDDGN